jgi:hypothetical protein
VFVELSLIPHGSWLPGVAAYQNRNQFCRDTGGCRNIIRTYLCSSIFNVLNICKNAKAHKRDSEVDLAHALPVYALLFLWYRNGLILPAT